jgi:hypothetical protein
VRRCLASVWVFAALTMAGPALSCSVVRAKGYAGSAQERRDVRKLVEQAAAIVDGEVVRPWTKEEPAEVEVSQVHRGWVGNFISVGGPSAGSECTIALKRTGERMRMILSGGPRIYDLYVDHSNPKLVDKILKSNRRKVWPYVAGESPLP